MGLDEARLDTKNPNYQQQLAKEKDYIDKILAAINTYNTTADIQRELNKIMAERAGDADLQTYSYIKNRTTFSLTNDEIEQTYQNIIEDFEDTISRLFGDTTVLAPSKERAALISMAYQGSIESVRSKLQQAMVTDNNRAEAWYLLRYKAIGNHYGAQDGGGHAKRHYYESQVFGLYDDPANVTLAEAEQAYRMLTKHRADILKYEKLYGTDPNGSTPEQAAQKILAANNDFSLPDADKVQTLVQAFNAAKNTLIADLLSRYAILQEQGLNTNDYRSSDILMASDPTKGATLELNARDGDERSAKNILIGTAHNDVLTGGKGDDKLIGGDGQDRYIWTEGDGKDTIIDSDQKGWIVIRGAEEAIVPSSFRPDESRPNTWVSRDGTITLTHSSPWRLVLPDGGEIELGDFTDGDFGIRLRALPATPERTLFLGTEGTDIYTSSVESYIAHQRC